MRSARRDILFSNQLAMTTESATLAARLRALLHHRSVVGITAGACVTIAAYVAQKMSPLAGIGLRTRVGVQVGLYLLASLLVTRIVLLVVLSRLSPRTAIDIALPLGRFGTLRGPAAWIVPLAAFLAMTLMREGEIQSLAFDFSLSTENIASHWDESRHYNVTTANAERRRLSQLALWCTVVHNGTESEIDRGFDNYIQCSREPPRSRDHVSVNISLHHPDVFCSVPLYRAASVRFDVNMDVTALWGDREGQGSGNGSVDVNGTIDVTSRGFMSCRRFNQMIGERIGAIAVERINEFLRTN